MLRSTEQCLFCVDLSQRFRNPYSKEYLIANIGFDTVPTLSLSRPKYGGMFCPPAIAEDKDPDSPKADMTPGTTLVNLTSGGTKNQGPESAAV